MSSLETLKVPSTVADAVIFCGVQASGKSSFYRAMFYRSHMRLNLDMLRTRHREEVLLRACFDAKQAVVIDNTNPTATERARYIGAARNARFKVVGYYFESKIDDALCRNASRPEAERIHQRGVLGTYARLEVPSWNEGFDELYYVRINSKDAFVVEEWRK